MVRKTPTFGLEDVFDFLIFWIFFIFEIRYSFLQKVLVP